MFHKQIQPRHFPSKPSRVAHWAATAAGGLLLAFAVQAYAAVMAGDQFNFNWTETSPDPTLSGTADLTLGAALTTPFFSIASFSVTQNGGFCGVCTPQAVDFGNAKFDALTFGLLGDITGTFIGSGGNHLHQFDLSLTDIANGTGTWTFKDTKLSDNSVEISNGSYTPLVPSVDEPPVMLLLALGLAGLAAWRRRRQ